MKDTAEKQLKELRTKYGWILTFALNNMRLLLLVLFAILSAYLVSRINALVNSEESTIPETSEQSPQTSSVSKTPDAEVLSIFDELTVQDVVLDSNFEDSRENPF